MCEEDSFKKVVELMKAVSCPLADAGDAELHHRSESGQTQLEINERLAEHGIDPRVAAVARDMAKHRKAAKLFAQ